uniref:RAP domain-containing protein n=1 Tax=Tetradesmus obliquus TaxID=3088 RepID=A0A383V6H2_TETOB|eukprot:jgi/Sobl393_1/19032/SZX60563.1
MLIALLKGSFAAAGSAAAGAATVGQAPLLVGRPAGRRLATKVIESNSRLLGSSNAQQLLRRAGQQQWAAPALLQQHFTSSSRAPAQSAAAGSRDAPGSLRSRLLQDLQNKASKNVSDSNSSGRGQSSSPADAADAGKVPAAKAGTSLARDSRTSSHNNTFSSHSSPNRAGVPAGDDRRAGLASTWKKGRQAIDAPLLTTKIKKATTVTQLQQLVQQHGSSVNYIHMAAIVNTLGNWQQQGKLRCGMQQQQVVQQLLADVDSLLLPGCWISRQHDIDRSQQPANVLYGAAKAEWQMEPGQAQQLLAALVRLLPGAEPQHVANSLWAAAELGQAPTEQQLQQLLAALVRLLPDAKPQHVANSLWAVATMGGKVQMQQLQLLLQHLASRLAEASPQGVSNSLWAVAKFAEQLADEQQQQVQQSQQLQHLLAGLTRKLAAANPQDVANSLWVCSQLRVYPAELFAAMDGQQQWGRLLPAMTGRNLANTALACAVLGHRDERLLAGLLQHALQLQTRSSGQQLNIQNVCNLCWSVAVQDAQQLAGSVVQLAQAAASSQQQWREFKTEDLMQLHQVHLWLLDGQLVGGRGLAGALTQQQLQHCSDACSESHQTRATQPPSAFQQQVFATLQQLTAAGQLSWQQQPAMEQLAQPDGACLIDIAGVTAGGVRLAIEADGPTHFLWPDRRLDGRSQHRNRVLAARIQVVVSVPYFEWDDLKGARQKQQYLLQLLNRAIQQQQQQQ